MTSAATTTAVVRITGTIFDDNITGTTADELIEGLDGDDKLFGGGGRDTIFGGNGNDVLDGGQSYDKATGKWKMNLQGVYLDGGAGDDRLYGGQGNDVIIGGSGNDVIQGNGGKDHLSGGDGDDIIDSAGIYDPVTRTYSADDFGDILEGGGGNDLLVGREGNDTLDGGTGRNRLFGDAGDDHYIINSVQDFVYDSSGTDSGVINVNWYKPSPTVEKWTWAPGVQKLPYWIDALTFAAAPQTALDIATTKVIGYSFAQAPTSIFTDKDKNGFTPFTAEQISYTRLALAYVESVLDVHFVERADSTAPFTITFGNNLQSGSGGYSQMMTQNGGGLLMLSTNETKAMFPSRDHGFAFFSIALHEIGHTLGLKHPFSAKDSLGNVGEGPYLPKAEDDTLLTIMSYTGDWFGDEGYSPYDLAALQYLYGVSPQLDADDTRWVIDDQHLDMIADGGGTDTIDASLQTTALTLYLSPGYWSYFGSKTETFGNAGQITINFGTVIENAKGGSGADHIVGNRVANVIDGGAGDDILEGGGGNDTLIGGAGLDSAVYAGKRAGFTINRGTDGWTVSDNSGIEGRDQLIGIERLMFTDGALAFDLDGTAGQAYRLYAAAFNRTPDLGGLGYWIAQMDKGMSLVSAATAFTHENEFTKMYGATRSATSFLDTLYHNILHRDADQGGMDYWAKTMQAGMTEGEVLASFSESPENQAQVAGAIANGIGYLPFG